MANTAGAQSQIDVKGKVLVALKNHVYMAQLKWADDFAKLKVSEIGGGNLNDVFRVYIEDDEGRSVILKHAPPYIKTSIDIPLTEERGQLEFNAMVKFDSLRPGSVPKPIFYDATLRVNLHDYVVYRTSLIDGHIDDDAALKLARDVAVIHRDTHVAKIGQDAIQQLDKEFSNREMIDLMEKVIFIAPFLRDDPTNRCSETVKLRLDLLYADQEVLQAGSNMKKIYLEKKEALIHGDLHTDSVMVKDKDTRVIDAEFAHVGPCSLDIGYLIANYIFNYYCHLLCPHDNDKHRQFAYRIVDICHQTVDSRVVGTAHAEEFNHTPEAEVDALGAGVRLLKAYHRIHSIGTLMLIALMLA